MRIAHVVRQYTPSVGGLENFVQSLAHALADLGHENQVLTLDRVFQGDGAALAPREIVAGIKVTRVPMMGHRRLFVPLMSGDLLAGYDVLHVHGIDGMFERVARHKPSGRQARVATSHGLFFHTPWMARAKRAYFASVTKLAARAYDGLIGNSASDVAALTTLGPPVVEIANGVEPLGAFTASGKDLLCLGRLSSHKRVDRLLAAMAEAPLHGARLHIVGPAWDVSIDTLLEQARALGVADRVLIYGKVSPQKLAEIAGACAVLVSASLYEGFGMSLIEAMSVGLIPVVEPNASFTQLVGKANIGALVSYADPAAAATVIAATLARGNPMLRANAQRFAAGYSWKANAAATAALYTQHVDDRARHIAAGAPLPRSSPQRLRA